MEAKDTNHLPSKSLIHQAMTRREFGKRLGIVGSGIPAISLLLASCGNGSESATEGAAPAKQPTARSSAVAAATRATGVGTIDANSTTTPGKGQFGGKLRVGLSDVPASLDPHMNTADITRDITNNVVENLFTMNSHFEVVPDLAASFEASSNNLAYTFKLRDGVKFHNNKELTTSDVIASLNRWMKLSSPGRAFAPSIESIASPSEGVIEIKWKDPIGHLLVAAMGFSYASAAILPKEQIDEAGDKGFIGQPIGTGPYKLESVVLDKEIKVARFDQYKSRSDPPDGMAGGKTAYFDEIVFTPISDVTVRTSALEAGDLDFATYLSLDDYERLKKNQGLQTILQFYGSADFVFNNAEGLTTDKRIRKAIQAALGCDDLMFAAAGNKDFYQIDPGLYPKSTFWWSDSGSENYNQNDSEKAKQLLADAGYDGTPLVWMTQEQGSDDYKRAIVAKSQLEKAGMKVNLVVTDWATILQRRQDPKGGWHVFSTSLDPQPDPTQYIVFDCGWWAFWCGDTKKDDLMKNLRLETDRDKRHSIWEELQTHYWEEAPAFQVGNFFNLHGAAKRLHGYVPMNGSQIFLYNVWLEQ